MKYYLVGIKGSGMSALACILKQQNNEVIGSDIDKDVFTQKNLDLNNIKYYSFSASNIDQTIDEVIVGNVFDQSHVEVEAALKLNIKVTKYIDFLKNLTSNIDTIAVSGTNGKTTTTSLLNHTLSHLNKMTLIGDSRGYSTTNPELFILEACEYRGNFLNYNCQTCVINNIEMDHPDYFTDVNHVIDTFVSFANKSSNLVVNYDDVNCQTLLTKVDVKNIVTFGLDAKATVNAQNVVENSSGYIIELHYGTQVYNDVLLPFYGEHMLYNALATLATCYSQQLDFNSVYNNLITFTGATRRFEETVIDENNDIILIDDYAHHPTSVELTLKAIKQKYPTYHLTTIFQAHTFSRVKQFGSEFGKALNVSDTVYVADIFGSIRETSSEVTTDSIINEIENKKIIDEISEISKYSNKHIIALLGAGDIDKIYKPQVIQLFKENNE